MGGEQGKFEWVVCIVCTEAIRCIKAYNVNIDPGEKDKKKCMSPRSAGRGSKRGVLNLDIIHALDKIGSVRVEFVVSRFVAPGREIVPIDGHTFRIRLWVSTYIRR